MQNTRKNYYRNYYLKTSIKNILIQNTDVFDEAREIILYQESTGDIIKGLPEYVSVYPEYLRIIPKENSFNDLLNVIDWETVNDVFIYKKDIPREALEIIALEKKHFFEYIKAMNNSKKELDPAWEFIYHCQPDMFLSKKTNSVMIGSLTNYSLVNIRQNMPNNNGKPEING